MAEHPSLEHRVESWVAVVEKRYPHTKAVIWIILALQFVYQGWTHMIQPFIDTATELQFIVQNWHVVVQTSLSMATTVGSALVSPVAALATFFLGFGYLVLDHRVAQHPQWHIPDNTEVAERFGGRLIKNGAAVMRCPMHPQTVAVYDRGRWTCLGHLWGGEKCSLDKALKIAARRT